ncbi:MAG: putative rane protein hemolysin [Planctomycetota bacterium]|nr:putative rane protein hemolysin [Planctomycetota bacterium]
MDVLDLRESVSAATHGAALIAAIPAIVVLIRRGRADLARTLALFAYGFGLVLCFAASTTCHALVVAGMASKTALLIDHMAIYFLIAGTYTPIVASLLPRHHRRPTLMVVWLAAAAGVVLNILLGPLPAWLATSFYLAMGWGGLWCYFGMRPSLSHAQLARIPLGGVLYTIGALFHVLKHPVLWPGVFEAHELFHLFVIAGAVAHFTFILTHVAGVERVMTGKRPGRRGVVIPGPPKPRFLGQVVGNRLVVRVKRTGA